MLDSIHSFSVEIQQQVKYGKFHVRALVYFSLNPIIVWSILFLKSIINGPSYFFLFHFFFYDSIF